MSNIVSSDPVADMLTRMRNAALVRKNEISLPHSNHKEAVARVLQVNNFVDKVTVTGEGITKTLVVVLNAPYENSHITEIKTLSTPGRRVYVSTQEIPTVKRGRGIVVLSTSKGMMTGVEAKAAGTGGELICSVY